MDSCERNERGRKNNSELKNEGIFSPNITYIRLDFIDN